MADNTQPDGGIGTPGGEIPGREMARGAADYAAAGLSRAAEAAAAGLAKAKEMVADAAAAILDALPLAVDVMEVLL